MPPPTDVPTQAPPGLLDALATGLALADPESLGVTFENERFRAWFPSGGGGAGNAEDGDADAGQTGSGGSVAGDADTGASGTLPTRIPGLSADALRDRLARGRPFRLDTEGASTVRPVPVQVHARPLRVGTSDAVLVEAVGIGRQKEAEYMLDSYSRMMERQTRALEQEKARAEKLLLNIMPRRIYEELKDFGTTTPQTFESASVLFLDFVGFTDMAISRDPAALISELNDVFTSFDRIVDHFRCERIKTIGDAYMAVAGVPEPDPDHEHNMARVALRMRRFLEKRNRSLTHRWRCRIGIGTGPVIGSIVGIHKYVYDIFGPAVNLASRLEEHCAPMQILVSAEAQRRIRDDFVLRPLGEVTLKGFEPQEVFALEDEVREGR